MPRVTDLDGREVELQHVGSFWVSLKKCCDNRPEKDTRSELAPGRVPELRWRWVIGLALVEEWQLSVGEVSRLFCCNKGNASRMIRKTRTLLRTKLAHLDGRVAVQSKTRPAAAGGTAAAEKTRRMRSLNSEYSDSSKVNQEKE